LQAGRKGQRVGLNAGSAQRQQAGALAALISSGFSSGFAIWKTRKMNFAVMTPCTENLS